VKLDDLRSLLDERSGAAPGEFYDHARRLSAVRHRVRIRRRRQGVAGAVAAMLVMGGYVAAGFSPSRHELPAQPPAPTRSASPITVTPDPTASTSSPAASSSARSGTATPGRPSTPTFPDQAHTGVPAGTALTGYAGPCTITVPNTVIDAKTITCDLTVQATGVVIKRSRVTGTVSTPDAGTGSVTIQDTEIDGGGVPAVVGGTNLTVLRSNVHGGTTSVHCNANCVVRDSYFNSFLANDDGPGTGGRTNAVLTHNTIACSGAAGSPDAGCSGNVKLFGDYGALSYVTLDNNLFVASTAIAYCVIGGSNASKPYNADHIVVTGNVFQRGPNNQCGKYGPVTDFDPRRPGNRWSGNTWDDGAPISAG
jgi:hypothetical protein